MPPTEKQISVDIRQADLAAALHLFGEKGFEGTKVVDIAGAVGMSVGLLFPCFESKERLYGHIITCACRCIGAPG